MERGESRRPASRPDGLHNKFLANRGDFSLPRDDKYLIVLIVEKSLPATVPGRMCGRGLQVLRYGADAAWPLLTICVFRLSSLTPDLENPTPTRGTDSTTFLGLLINLPSYMPSRRN